MTYMRETWHELGEKLEGLGLKLKLHLEQTSDGAMPEALSKLGQGVQDTFEAAGNAIKDDAVKDDVREVGRLIADLIEATVNKVGDEVRDAVKRH